ncbi:type II toxin-antitoxin system HicA family toxin [Deinococcus rubellus]
MLTKHGWTEQIRGGTNHRKWTKENEEGFIILSGNSSRESDKGQQNAVLRRLGLK